MQEALVAIEQDTGAPLGTVATYPDHDRPVRLPFGDCLTITDQWLNKGGEVDLKANVVRLMDFVRDKGRRGVALAEVIGYIKDRLRFSSKRASLARKPGRLRTAG